MIHSKASPLVEHERQHVVMRTLLRAGLCLGTFSLVAMQALLAQVPSSQTLTAPAITSGTYGYMATSDIAASTNFTVSRSASVTFTAGHAIHLENGFRATARTATSTFDAL